jgi:hypothetical protein
MSVKISQMLALVGALAGTEKLEVSVPGAPPLTKSVTAQQIAALFGGFAFYDVLLEYGGDPLAAMAALVAEGGSGILFFRRKPDNSSYNLGTAPLQDPGRGNAQLLLPSKHVLNQKQITVMLIGEVAPPPIFSVVGGTTTPDQHVIIESELNTVGGAMIGGWGPVGSYLDYTFLQVVIRNLAFRLPPNPNMTALDLEHVTGVDVDQVVVDAGQYFVDDMDEPTEASSYGTKFPGRANGATTRVGLFGVAGYYNAFRTSEHFQADYINIFGCKFPAEFIVADHASQIKRMGTYHCPHGPKWSGEHYVQIQQIDYEHAQPGAPAWTANVDDLFDPSNLGFGELCWHTVTGNVGITHTFTRNGGKNITVRELGSATDESAGVALQVACSDESTAITAGAGKVSLRHVGRRCVREVRASLRVAQTSGAIFTVDINVGGVSILSTKLTVDNTETTSTTAATQAVVIAGTVIPDDALITVDVDQVGDGTAAGLKVTII